ncbi:nitroreductase family protein [bacterium]|nr:nitroreductase family protein [bacterium]
MKIKICVLSGIFLFFNAFLSGQTAGNKIIDFILSAYSTRTFSEKPVQDSEIEQILKCGIKAPSARNSQPWKFTVVKDTSKVQGLFRSINQGNVIIIVSGPEEGRNIDFDCALAVENMYLAAQGMGLGARIYTGPVRRIDEEMKKTLAVPDGYRVVALLRIGNLDNRSDAISAASARKEMNEVVNYTE